MYHLTQFGVALPPGQVRVEAGTGAILPTHAIALPGGGVYDTIDTIQAGRAAIRVRLRVELVGSSTGDLKNQFTALRQMVGQRRQLHRRWACDDSTTEWAWARLEEVQAETQTRFPLWLPVELRFMLLSPYWRGDERTVNYSGGSGTATLSNSGNLTATDALFTVTATTTLPTGITVTNTTLGGAGWAYTAALTSGDVLIVNSETRTVTKNGVAAYTDFALTGNEVAWLPLAPGGNVVDFAMGGGTASVLVVWHDGWM